MVSAAKCHLLSCPIYLCTYPHRLTVAMPRDLATKITNTLDLEFDRRCRPQAPHHLTELSLSGKPIHAKAKVDCHLGGSCMLATKLTGSVAIQSLRVYAATLTFDGPRHAFPEQCCIKMAYGANEYPALKREYRFYSHALRSLGGIAVPRCHGFFSTEEDGELVGCLVLDLCVGATSLKGIQRNNWQQRQELK